MKENIKRKLQLKYIFNTIRFKIYCGGYMKGFYSHTKKKKKTTTTTTKTKTKKNKKNKQTQLKIISNNLNNHSSIKLAKHYKLQS